MTADLRELDKLRKHVPEIIADGVFGALSPVRAWETLLWEMGAHRTKREKAALEGLLERIEAQFPESTRLPFPEKDDPDNRTWSVDLISPIAAAYGDVGFMIGLAVGSVPYFARIPAPAGGRRGV